MERVPLEAILNAMTEGMIVIDPSAAVVSINAAALRLFGFSSVEDAKQRLPIWREYFEVTYFDGRPIEPSDWPLSRALQGQSFTDSEIVIRNGFHGEWWAGSFNGSFVRDPRGWIIRSIITVRDITGKRRAEQALSESEGRFRRMADSAPVMIWTAGLDRLCTFVNCKWLSFRKRTMEQELGDGWTEGVHRDDLEQLVAVYNSSFDEQHSFTTEYRLRRWDGEYRWILAQGDPQYSSEGEFLGYMGGCIDITEVRMMRQDALARQKLETIGVLAGGIAHDFNNLLGAILAEAELALTELPAHMAANEEINKIKTVALRGSEIVRELMIYSGQDAGTLELIDIAKLSVEMVQLIRVSVSKHARIEIASAPNLPAIHANTAQIRQVIMNLVVNASEAIGDVDGKICLSMRQVGDFVQLEVSDNGRGMDWGTRERIFDPFFTTKYTGRGFGLAVVQAIVHKCGGFIELETALGRGSSFRIMFPSAKVAPPEEKLEPARAQSASRPAALGTILLVEDEPNILMSVSKMLRMRGFSTLDAADGSSAISLLQDEEKVISVMLLDMTITGKSSREVFEEARRRRPDTKILLTTAYSEKFASASISWPQVDGFIRKPYEISSLERLINQVLND